MKKDFQKYLLSSSINSSYSDDYFKKIQKINNSQGFIDLHSPVDIYSKLLDDRIIFLSTDIDDYICNIIKAQLLYLESESDEDINLYIESCGGGVYSGLGLIDVMEYIKPDVATFNTGLAASMAAVILCCGAKGKRKALKRSRTMIHQPIGGGWASQASDIEIEAREINSVKKELYEIISEKTGQSYEKIHKDGDRDYWLNAIESKKYGIVDEIMIKRK